MLQASSRFEEQQGAFLGGDTGEGREGGPVVAMSRHASVASGHSWISQQKPCVFRVAARLVADKALLTSHFGPQFIRKPLLAERKRC